MWISVLKDEKGRWELTPESAMCQVLCTGYLWPITNNLTIGQNNTISHLQCQDVPTYRNGSSFMGFPSGSVVKNLPANAGDTDLIPDPGRSPGEEPTPLFLPGKSHRQRSLAGYSLWSHKESDITEQLSTAQQHKTGNPLPWCPSHLLRWSTLYLQSVFLSKQIHFLPITLSLTEFFLR